MNRFAQTVVTVLLAPFGLALGILVFGTLGIMVIPLSVRGYFEHRQWFQRMRCSGRTLASEEISGRGGSGTLIVDQPGWKGKAKYCWWTPDDVESLTPVPITSLSERFESVKYELNADSLPLDRWIYNTYLSYGDGTAYLVTTKRGDLVASQLQADMIDLQLIETWSAPVGEFGGQNAG
ncbi:MAG: hypothetical protein ACR2OA_12670 [Rubripirellula sp.]|jgi:hypothetical protein